MFAKALSVAVAVATLASAQTHTDCQPLEKTCPANPAFGKERVNCDLTKGACDEFFNFDGTTIDYNEKGAVFSISKGTQAPTVGTKKFIFFGRVDVELQAANGAGIITSMVLQSQDLDEIDWEWVGGDNKQVQSNYFGKGDDSTFDRGGFHDVSEPLTSFHTYSIEYNSKVVNWLIDGAVVRTLAYGDAKGGSRYPQTPMQIRLGTWVGGLEGKPQGTIDWAGGIADFSKGPFNAYYKSIAITDYAGGDAPTDKTVKEYLFGDKTGSFESIKIIPGDGSSDDDEDKTTSKTSTKTTSKEESKTKTEDASKTSDSETTKDASKTASTTLATKTSSAATTPEAPETTSAPSETEAPPAAASTTTSQPGAASALNLGAALLLGAGMMAAQLLL